MFPRSRWDRDRAVHRVGREQSHPVHRPPATAGTRVCWRHRRPTRAGCQSGRACRTDPRLLGTTRLARAGRLYLGVAVNTPIVHWSWAVGWRRSFPCRTAHRCPRDRLAHRFRARRIPTLPTLVIGRPGIRNRPLRPMYSSAMRGSRHTPVRCRNPGSQAECRPAGGNTLAWQRMRQRIRRWSSNGWLPGNVRSIANRVAQLVSQDVRGSN
jgi:hypothetical protein